MPICPTCGIETGNLGIHRKLHCKGPAETPTIPIAALQEAIDLLDDLLQMATRNRDTYESEQNLVNACGYTGMQVAYRQALNILTALIEKEQS